MTTQTNQAPVTGQADEQDTGQDHIETGDEGGVQLSDSDVELGADMGDIVDTGVGVDTEVGEDQDQEADGIAIDTEQDFSIKLLKVGVYPATIMECEYVKSQSSDQPMLTGTVAINTDEGDFTLRYFLSFSPKAQAGTMRTIQTCFQDILSNDYRNQQGKWLPKLVADSGVLIGREVRVNVNVRPYQGQKRNNVAGFLPPGQGMMSGSRR
jgi:hypothetical protein